MDTDTALATIKEYISQCKPLEFRKPYESDYYKSPTIEKLKEKYPLPVLTPEKEQLVIDILDEKKLYMLNGNTNGLDLSVIKLIHKLLKFPYETITKTDMGQSHRYSNYIDENLDCKYVTAVLMALGNYAFYIHACKHGSKINKLEELDPKYKGYYYLGTHTDDDYSYSYQYIDYDNVSYERDQLRIENQKLKDEIKSLKLQLSK